MNICGCVFEWTLSSLLRSVPRCGVQPCEGGTARLFSSPPLCVGFSAPALPAANSAALGAQLSPGGRPVPPPGQTSVWFLGREGRRGFASTPSSGPGALVLVAKALGSEESLVPSPEQLALLHPALWSAELLSFWGALAQAAGRSLVWTPA
jgi:hypothetical protein